jgi:formylglycine-generating enzyme
MHVNVWELCQDWYGAYPIGAVVDPKGPSEGPLCLGRGGSSIVDAGGYRLAFRPEGGVPSWGLASSVGFRVALSPY